MDGPFPAMMVEDIEEFFRTEYKRKPGFNIYPEVFDVGTFFPLQRKKELARMIEMARSIKPKVIMEIGADKGGGLYHWCKGIESVEKIIACEIRGCPYRALFDQHFPDIEFLWCERSSHDREVFENVQHFLSIYLGDVGKDQLIDVLFIDGDKGGFLQDFDDFLPLMNPNGLIFFHDYRDMGPKDAWEVIRERGYKTNVILDMTEGHEAAERVKNNIPVSSGYDAWLRHWQGQSCGVGVVNLAANHDVVRKF